MSVKKFIFDSKMFEYDRHYRVCQQNNHPFIKAWINQSTGNYYVQIDLMTCNYNFTADGKNKVLQLFKNEIRSLESCYSPFNGYNVDKELAWFDGVLPDRLVAFCETLFDISQNFHD